MSRIVIACYVLDNYYILHKFGRASLRSHHVEEFINRLQGFQEWVPHVHEDEEVSRVVEALQNALSQFTGSFSDIKAIPYSTQTS